MKIETHEDKEVVYLNESETILLLDAWKEFYIFSYKESSLHLVDDIEVLTHEITESIIDGYTYMSDYAPEFNRVFNQISKGLWKFNKTHIIPDKKTVQSYGIESVIAMKYL